MRAITAFAIVFAASAFASGITLASARQQSTKDQPFSLLSPSLYGVDNFRNYCAPCHGRDGAGHGPVAPALKVAPADLTKLSAKNNGVFLAPACATTSPMAPATSPPTAPVRCPCGDRRSARSIPRTAPSRSAFTTSSNISRPYKNDDTHPSTRTRRASSRLLLLAGAADGHAQTARTGRLMQEKLTHAQRILAALTTSNYGLLQKETLALQRLTQSPQWNELMTAELRGRTRPASSKRWPISPPPRIGVTTTAPAGSTSAVVAACINCHKHVMNSRIARAP